MKVFILTLSLLSSISSFAEVRREFDEATEKRCHSELKALGCVKDETENPSCAELNKQKLSGGCHSLFEAKKTK